MKAEETKKLGTFLGVYTPTIMTILGVIMYMRAGWVVGHMGLILTLLIVVIANLITLITTLSFSSIATNKKIGAGGAYYIISRTLGLRIGGAIGVPLFLSQTFSITLYSFGIAEVLNFLVPAIPVASVAFVVIVIVAILSFKGADFAMKTQIPVMALVAISIVFLAVGAFLKTDISGVQLSSRTGEVTFFAAFAIFFSAVTGIMAGLGLSGDLKNPQKSIPWGAITATLTGFVIYLAIPVFLAMGADNETLKNDVMVWAKIAPAGLIFVIPGLLGSIFSSAVGSMLGAPRTLGALAVDQFQNNKILEFLNSEKGEKAAFIVSLIIACGAVFLGNLNAVATVTTLFFLTVYGVVNIAAALEGLSNEPSWRPKFKVPWLISLGGGVACVVVMFLINPIASFVAIVIEFLLYVFFKKQAESKLDGDARRGVYEKVIKNSLLSLKSHPMSVRNWRPNLQVLIEDFDIEKQINLIKFASFIGENAGIVTVTQIVKGKLGEEKIDVESKVNLMNRLFEQKGLVVFPEVIVTDNFENGVIASIQSNGVAELRSNTVMVNWSDNTEYMANCLSIMRKIAAIKKSFVIGKTTSESNISPKRQKLLSIHVWWGGLQYNGDMMLLMAYLLKSSGFWKNSTITVISIVDSKEKEHNAYIHLDRLTSESRINADVKIIINEEKQPFSQIIQSVSADADAVFMGLKTPEKGEEADYALKLKELSGSLKSVFFIKNSGMFKGALLDTEFSEKGSENG
ncbi:MAG: hypothetical protein ACOX2F_00395 [bacterium]